MTHKELFTEFIKFRWVDNRSEQSTEIPGKDVALGDFTIARINSRGCIIHYLANGNKVEIPKTWMDLFTSFNIYAGAQVIHEGLTGDNIDKMIYYMLLLVVVLDLKRGDEFLKILGSISEIKTLGFRNWVKENFNINLEPIQFTSIKKDLDI